MEGECFNLIQTNFKVRNEDSEGILKQFKAWV